LEVILTLKFALLSSLAVHVCPQSSVVEPRMIVLPVLVDSFVAFIGAVHEVPPFHDSSTLKELLPPVSFTHQSSLTSMPSMVEPAGMALKS
jgi:hypothetical protein